MKQHTLKIENIEIFEPIPKYKMVRINRKYISDDLDLKVGFVIEYDILVKQLSLIRVIRIISKEDKNEKN